MKAISLHQPWASLIALGLKHYETRSWLTSYRGKLAIHAAKRPIDYYGRQLLNKVLLGANLPPGQRPFPEQLPLGCVVAVCRLIDCRLMVEDFSRSSNKETRIGIIEQTELEKALGDWRSGRYAWKLDNIVALPKPVGVSGRQGLWNWDQP